MTAQTFKLPDLGEGLTESEVLNWKIKVGEHVSLNQIIAEVETAKAVVELPSPFAGIVQKLHADEGQVVPVGGPLVTFDDKPVDLDGKGGAQPGAEAPGRRRAPPSGLRRWWATALRRPAASVRLAAAAARPLPPTVLLQVLPRCPKRREPPWHAARPRSASLPETTASTSPR